VLPLAPNISIEQGVDTLDLLWVIFMGVFKKHGLKSSPTVVFAS